MKQLPGQQITNLVASTALTVPAGARYALLGAEAQNVRWTDDGVTTPTAAIGQLLLVGQYFLYDLGPLSKLRFIQAAGGGILNVTYYGVLAAHLP